MTAQVDLRLGGEPTDCPDTVLTGKKEGGLGEENLGGYVLQFVRRQPLFEDAHGGRVSGKRTLAKGVDAKEGEFHQKVAQDTQRPGLINAKEVR